MIDPRTVTALLVSSGANLTEANLTGANLAWANLTETNLTGADLSGANLRGANLDGHKLTGEWQLFAPAPRGYSYLAFQTDDDARWLILAGCRRFTLAEAVAHWAGDTRMDGAIARWVLPRLALLED